MIDLHVHSNASDGSLAPMEIVHLAVARKLAAIALTDHDTVAGTREVLTTGVPPEIEFLTGVEISAAPPGTFKCPGSFHILGYDIRLDDTRLNHELKILQEARRQRNPRIIQRLNSLGFDLSLDELREAVGDCQIGRPHIAQLMQKKGFVTSIDEAFDRYIGNGKPAYVEKYRIDCRRAIEIILGAGGIPVLAHPILLKNSRDQNLEDLIVLLKQMGLAGIEVYYPEHSPRDIAHYRDLAQRYDLLMTGGTDFHGDIVPDIQLGCGRGDFWVPYQIFENLIRNRYP